MKNLLIVLVIVFITSCASTSKQPIPTNDWNQAYAEQIGGEIYKITEGKISPYVKAGLVNTLSENAISRCDSLLVTYQRTLQSWGYSRPFADGYVGEMRKWAERETPMIIIKLYNKEQSQ